MCCRSVSWEGGGVLEPLFCPLNPSSWSKVHAAVCSLDPVTPEATPQFLKFWHYRSSEPRGALVPVAKESMPRNLHYRSNEPRGALVPVAQERPYICGFCGDCFVRSDELRVHASTHSEVAHSGLSNTDVSRCVQRVRG